MTNPPAPNDPEVFAAHLRAQSPVELPTRWRAEILTAALDASLSPEAARWHPLSDALLAWLWPRPLAYAGLMAMWVLIFALRLLTPASALGPAPLPPGQLAAAPTAPVDGLPIFEQARFAFRDSSFSSANTGQP